MHTFVNMAFSAAFSPVLLNTEANTLLDEQGYVVFPFLDKPLVAALTEFYYKAQKNEPERFFASTHSPDFEFRKHCSTFIKNTVAPVFAQHFTHCRLLGGAFVAKPGQGKGILQPHRDWNLVDETMHRSYNLWIPLVDVNETNGAVFVLPASHHQNAGYRGPGFAAQFSKVENLLWQHMKPLNMKAGDALFYDHALIHGSPPNHSNMLRLGIVAGVLPQNAQMQLYCHANNAVTVYNCSENFFLEHAPDAAASVLQEVQRFPYTHPELTAENFQLPPAGIQNEETVRSGTHLFRNLLSKLKRW